MKALSKTAMRRLSLLCALLLAIPVTYLALQRVEKTNELQAIETTHGMFEVHHWTSPEGTKIAFTPLHELPILDIHVVYAAGSAYEGDKFGTAQLLQQLLGEDTTEMTGDAIHEAFESVGAQFGASVGRDMLDISLRTLSDPQYRDPALRTLEAILGKTTFTQPAFDRGKNDLLTSITSDKQNPRAMISQAFFQALYGSHPYAHPVSGSTESVTALSLQEVQSFHQTHLVKENAIIAIAGDLTLEEAKALSEDLLRVIPSGQVAAAIPPVPAPKASTENLRFPSSQTHLIMGIPALAKGNPDFFALTVGNQILGVTPLVNRLFNVVREQEGLAYNVGSALTTLKQPGPFSIYLQSRASEANKAESLVNETLARFLKEGPTEAELKDAKANLYGQFALGLSNNAAIAAHLAMLAFYDLPWDYQDHFQEKIEAVTVEDVKKIFAQYIHPEEFTQVRLGETQ